MLSTIMACVYGRAKEYRKGRRPNRFDVEAADGSIECLAAQSDQDMQDWLQAFVKKQQPPSVPLVYDLDSCGRAAEESSPQVTPLTPSCWDISPIAFS